MPQCWSIRILFLTMNLLLSYFQKTFLYYTFKYVLFCILNLLIRTPFILMFSTLYIYLLLSICLISSSSFSVHSFVIIPKLCSMTKKKKSISVILSLTVIYYLSCCVWFNSWQMHYHLLFWFCFSSHPLLPLCFSYWSWMSLSQNCLWSWSRSSPTFLTTGSKNLQGYPDSSTISLRPERVAAIRVLVSSRLFLWISKEKLSWQWWWW